MRRPTERTMVQLRASGYMVGVVEAFNFHTQRRLDLFGMFDLIAVGEGRIVGIQCGVGSGHAAHREKIVSEKREAAATWIANGGEIEIWSWRRLAAYRKDGTRAKRDRWQPRIEPITKHDVT